LCGLDTAQDWTLCDPQSIVNLYNAPRRPSRAFGRTALFRSRLCHHWNHCGFYFRKFLRRVLTNIKQVAVENKTADPIFLSWINVLWLSPSQFAVHRARCSSPGSEIAMKSMIEESNWAPFLSALVVVAIATTIIVWLMPPNF